MIRSFLLPALWAALTTTHVLAEQLPLTPLDVVEDTRTNDSAHPIVSDPSWVTHPIAATNINTSQSPTPNKARPHPVQDHAPKVKSASLAVDNESSSPILDDEFDAWLAQLAKEWSIKGLGVAVVRKRDNADGKGQGQDSVKWDVETRGYGIRNSKGDPVTNETVFSICSNSKLFTALALGTLIDGPPHQSFANNHLQTLNPRAGHNITFTWNTKIVDILPPEQWALQDPVASAQANILDIFSHRTGLPRHDGGWHRNQTTEDALSRMRYLRPSTGFRQTFQYNNWMYMVAAHIVTHVSGLPFADYVHQNIISKLPFSPYAGYNALGEALASGHLAEGFVAVETNSSSKEAEGWSKTVWKPSPMFVDSLGLKDILGGPGGVFLSVKDVAVWLQTLLLEGRHPETNEQIIPAESIRRVASGITVQSVSTRWPEVSHAVYGAGQGSSSYQGHHIVEHNGGWPGWRTVIARAPEDGLGVAVFTNWDEGGYVSEIIKLRLFEKALGLRHVDWSTRYRDLESARLTEITTKKVLLEDQASKTMKSLDLRPFGKYIGTYYNPAYGDVHLCPPASPSDREGRPVMRDYGQLEYAGFRKYCRISNELDAETPNEQRNAIFAASYDGAVAHFLRFHYQSPSKFNVSMYYVPDVRPGQQDRLIAPMVDRQESYVEFEFDETGKSPVGFAWNGVWGQGADVEELPQGETVKERAEVWFEKVGKPWR